MVRARAPWREPSRDAVTGWQQLAERAPGKALLHGRYLYLSKLAIVSGSYFVTAKLGLALADLHGSVTAVWAPTGIALAAVFTWGYRIWPAVALGAFLANSWTGVPLITVLGITTGNTLEALVGVYLLRRVGFEPSLQRVRDVLALVTLAAGLSTMVSATIGVVSLLVGGSLSADELASVWPVWWFGDMGGDLLVAPFLLMAAARGPLHLRSQRIAEAAVLLLALVAASLVAFSHGAPLVYLVFPVLIWAALRFRQQGAVAASLVVSAIAVWFTARDIGPFVQASPDGSLLLSQTFVGVAAVTVLLLAAVTTERIRTEEERILLLRRARFLAESTKLLASSLEYEATLHRIARLAVPDVADWCVVDLHVDGSVRRVATAHVDPSKVELAEELGRRCPVGPDASRGALNAIRTGRSELYAEISDALVVESAEDGEHLEILCSLGMISAMVVPMLAHGRSLGAITMVSAESGRHFDEGDLAFAEDLARRAATAVDNARLYQEQSHVAQTLQESLLPPDPPDIPGVELAVRFRPAGGGAELGGDFYDVFKTSESRWMIIIGDVCGKGAGAAALTSLARYTLRAGAILGLSPSRALSLLNDAILRQGKDFCSAICAEIESTGFGARLTIASAGHPLPFLLDEDGTVNPLGGYGGTVLGVLPDANLSDRTVDLEPGDTVVFYTDGVTEARTPAGMLGQSWLSSLLRSSAGLRASEIVELLERAVLNVQGEDPRDDIAVLSLSVSPPVELSVELAGGARAACEARTALRRLEGHVEPPELNDLYLLATELVTNSVRHGAADSAGSVRFSVSVSPRTVRLEVADRGSGFAAWTPPADVERSSGWGLYIVDRLADRWGIDRDAGMRVWVELDRVESPVGREAPEATRARPGAADGDRAGRWIGAPTPMPATR